MAAALVASFVRRFDGGPEVECRLELSPRAAPITVLFGPSGAGKTTILRCLAGLERPDSGRIAFGAETWFASASGTALPPQARGIGYVSQDDALFPHLSVAGNVAFGIEGLPRGERDERVRELLRLLRLEDLAERRPAQLSGGQKQRTSLARALATAPRLLLLDEPLSALDAPAREELRGELRRLLVAVGRPALFVTHDRLEALAIGDRLAVVVSGRIAQIGPVEEVFSRPASPEVARLVGVETVVAARIVERPGDGMVLLAVAAGDSGELLLSAIDPGGDEDAVLACVRADEVVLERGPIGQVSARNRLACRIVSLAPEGPLVRVGLDCGFRLTALVTRQSRSEMELEPGAEVTAFVKTPSVHLIPHRRPG